MSRLIIKLNIFFHAGKANQNKLVLLLGVVVFFVCTNQCGKEEPAPLAPEPEFIGKSIHGNNARIVDAPSGLRMRSKPAVNARTVMVIPHQAQVRLLQRSHTKVKIDAEEAYWYQIDFQARQGWVFGAYLQSGDHRPANLKLVQAFLGDWYGGNQCDGKWTRVNLKQNGLFKAFLFGGCDVGGCHCVELSGHWKLKKDKICLVFKLEAEPESVHFLESPDRPACYFRQDDHLKSTPVDNPILENYRSESLLLLGRASDDFGM